MPRTVLAALLLDANRVVSAARLSDMLWGDRPPSSAATSLQNHVGRLRAFLGPAGRGRIQTTAPGYLIRVQPGELDLDSFRTLAECGYQARLAGDWAAAARDLRAALELWRGSPLADVTSAAIQAIDAPRLEQLRLAALEARMDTDLRLGRPENVIPELNALIAEYPLREGFHGTLMLACYQSGRRADALAAYGRVRALLRDELGVDPGAELQQLHQRILAGDQGLAPSPGTRLSLAAPRPEAVPGQLPADIPDFTGRDRELTRLCELFSAAPGEEEPGVVPVAVITGTGGAGKTTLALRVAHLVKDRYPDGQLYVNLRGAAPAAEILTRLLRDLGTDAGRIPATAEERAGLLRTLLSDRSTLLVLDDAASTGQVRPLLPGSARCGVLVTSRSRLSGLAGTHLDLDGLDDDAARALLAGVAGAARVAAEPAATASLIQLTAGLPLAIRIAGARVAARPGWALADLAARLAGQHRLDELTIDDLAVRASFQLSYDDLPGAADGPGPARAFRLLGIADGTDIGLPAAAALLGVSPACARGLLEPLVDAHLLESHAADRYRLHDLLRVYARERAEAEETESNRRSAIHRLVSWYLRTADAAAGVLEPRIERVPLDAAHAAAEPLDISGYEAAIAWCEAERANLTAAVSQAARSGLHAIAWQLPVALRRFFRLGKYWTDWIGCYEVALASARATGNQAAAAWILSGLGEPYADLGQHDRAIDVRTQALAISREIGDRRGEAGVLVNIGVIYGLTSRHTRALAGFESALAIFRELGDSYNQARALANIGASLRLLREYDRAVTHLRQALAIQTGLGGGSYSEASVLRILADTYGDMGRPAEAARCFVRAAAISRALHDRGGEAEALEGLGLASLLLGHDGTARRFWARAEAILSGIGDPRAAAIGARIAALMPERGAQQVQQGPAAERGGQPEHAGGRDMAG